MHYIKGSSRFLPHLNQLHAAEQQVATDNSHDNKDKPWNLGAFKPKHRGLYKLIIPVHTRPWWLIPNADLNT
jgi:hypothetical protein